MDINNKINILNKINNINQKAAEKTEPKESFKDLLQNFVGDVNKMQQQADDSVNKLASGEINNIHDVMVKVEEANLSFSLMMKIRNKIIEGYKEVIKTQV